MGKNTDVLIIGGGIAGIGAAAHMAADATVTVLEAEEAIGYHSTGRSAAIFVRNYGNATLRALNIASEPILHEPVDISDSSLLTQRGFLFVATGEHEAALATEMAGAPDLEAISPADAQKLVPILRAEMIRACALETSALDIDVDRLLQGFARLLRQRGGNVATGARAEKISRQNDVWQVETSKGTFTAPVLVNAAGAWADRVATLAGVAPLGLQPMRRSAAILPAPEGHDVSGWPMVACPGETWYFKPEAGKLMVSPADKDPCDPFDAWPDDMVLAEGLHRFEQVVTTSVTRVERSWAGLRSFFPDKTPAVGFASDAEGFFWLAGQGGYGVQTAPAMSALAAALVVGRTPTLDPQIVSALAPERLSQK